MNLFAGNLAKEMTEAELKEVFEKFGQVTSVAFVMDRYSGQPRGFAFVEMPVKSEALAAIDNLSGRVALKGKAIFVKEARPQDKGHGGHRPSNRNKRR